MDDESLPDTWHELDLPVLRAIVAASDDVTSDLALTAAAREQVVTMGIMVSKLDACIGRLKAGGYITTSGQQPFMLVTGVTGKGRVATGISD